VYVRLVIRREKGTPILKVGPVMPWLRLGTVQDHTTFFVQTRQKVVDRTYLEVNRLEKRLTKV
jgi:hypothetical protein